MFTEIPDKLLLIVDEIDEKGHAPLTKLTVLKKWFKHPGRLGTFALWVGARATSRKGKTKGEAGNLFKQARALLVRQHPVFPKVDRKTAEKLHDNLKLFQNQYEKQRWGPVRIVKNWNLFLVEQGLAVWLWHTNSPADGYKLASDYCRHYDSAYGTDLNGPSRAKIMELVRFMFTVEALEDRDAP
ncbi:hypothetical protein HYR69_00805 [Candidatus Sumerlaeota bacterium]|nr:hypothetical protein [Candidatus Sumerlaeota bacterium]MBI3735491.1 hypothetical protein [Candidatus Sumerlaeota bacterium]